MVSYFFGRWWFWRLSLWIIIFILLIRLLDLIFLLGSWRYVRYQLRDFRKWQGQPLIFIWSVTPNVQKKELIWLSADLWTIHAVKAYKLIVGPHASQSLVRLIRSKIVFPPHLASCTIVTVNVRQVFIGKVNGHAFRSSKVLWCPNVLLAFFLPSFIPTLFSFPLFTPIIWLPSTFLSFQSLPHSVQINPRKRHFYLASLPTSFFLSLLDLLPWVFLLFFHFSSRLSSKGCSLWANECWRG